MRRRRTLRCVRAPGPRARRPTQIQQRPSGPRSRRRGPGPLPARARTTAINPPRRQTAGDPQCAGATTAAVRILKITPSRPYPEELDDSPDRWRRLARPAGRDRRRRTVQRRTDQTGRAQRRCRRASPTAPLPASPRPSNTRPSWPKPSQGPAACWSRTASTTLGPARAKQLRFRSPRVRAGARGPTVRVYHRVVARLNAQGQRRRPALRDRTVRTRSCRASALVRAQAYARVRTAEGQGGAMMPVRAVCGQGQALPGSCGPDPMG